MPHTGIHAISARQNKMNKRWVPLVVLTGVRVMLQISVLFTPLSTFRFQPLPGVASHGVNVDITFHYVTSQFSTFGRLGVARRSLALLGDIDACKSRRSQISALLAGFAALAATTCSSSWRRWQSHGVDHSTPSHYINNIYKYNILLARSLLLLGSLV